MSTEIYYFSGSGNSLHVARGLQKRLPEAELIPIVSLLNQNVIEAEADTIGIVFPLQGPTFPNPVKTFLQKVDLKSADYIFAVATRGGTTCRIRKEIDKILKKKEKRLSSHFVMTVFNNDPKLKSDDSKHSFHMLSEIELSQKTEEIESKLDLIKDIIINKEISHKKDTEYSVKMGFILEHLILLALKTQEHKSIKDYFYTDSKCTGCGLCERVCLSKKIVMKNGKPDWQDSKLCYMCYACLNFCPRESVQINDKWFMKSFTTTHGRYSHPYASATDIERQKHYIKNL